MSEDSLASLKSALNPQQLDCVVHGDGPQLVLAGAGSGKTRVITYRIAWLIRDQGVEPYRIAAVTFTNKAASEMRERVARLVGDASGVFVGTFHRFGVRLLRRYGERIGVPQSFTILDSSDQLSLVKQALKAEGLSDKSFPPRAVLARISGAKNRLLEPDAFEAEADGFFDNKVALLYRRYQGLLRGVRGVDFDDLIRYAVRLLSEEADLGDRMRRRLRYLLVDEFQDTNYAQVRLIHNLTGHGGNLTAVGDEDQSIYRWRGAELDNILQFEKLFPRAVIRKLEQNYRSSQCILDAAGAVVENNEQRWGKRLWTEAGQGEPLHVYRAADELDEASWLVHQYRLLHKSYPYRQMAILMRTNAQTRAVEDELLRQKVPYCLVAGVRFYDRAEVKDMMAYLRLLRDPQDNHSLRRIINQPARGIGKATLDMLVGAAEDLGNSLWDAIVLDRLDGLSTRSRRALGAFKTLIQELRQAATEQTLPDLLRFVLERTGYQKLYERPEPEAEAKLENLRELVSAAQQVADDLGVGDLPALSPLIPRPEDDSLDFEDSQEPTDPLTSFLDYVALVSDTDALETELGVSLMTLHSAKGLEFPVVTVAGLEDGLLPHFNSQATPDDLEEERRLLYVGMTRARERLLLTCCQRRRVAGRYQDQRPSPFLEEIPDRLVHEERSPRLSPGHGLDAVRSFFDGEAGENQQRPYLEDPEAQLLRKGCRVRHATLGDGVLLDIDGEGEDARLTVFFTGAGKRRLLKKFAALHVI